MISRNLFAILGIFCSVAVLAAPASAAGVRFGAKLTNTLFPSNAAPGRFCDESKETCTWVSLFSINRSGGQVAPKDGKLAKLRLISCHPGELRLVIAHANPNTDKAKAVSRTKLLDYEGDSHNCNKQTYDIQVIKLNPAVSVKKGDYLAIEARRFFSLRCDSGSKRILQYVPPLVAGAAARTATSTETCSMLIEAEYQ